MFLFDEPFGAVDEITREHLNDETQQLFQAEGFAGLFITHSIPEMHAVALRTDKGIVMHTGDWKLDDGPVLGTPSLRLICHEGETEELLGALDGVREPMGLTREYSAERTHADYATSFARIGLGRIGENEEADESHIDFILLVDVGSINTFGGKTKNAQSLVAERHESLVDRRAMLFDL